MKQLAKELNLLPLRLKKDTAASAQPVAAANTPGETLNKEELRLLVKILKAIGHTCEHPNIRIQNGITSYTLNQITLIFDGVNKTDEHNVLHLSSLKQMLEDPAEKRPTWEKLKSIQFDA
ncbi:hypothetical protein GCM10011365_12050 [Marinicella pacifica]|uniref:Uncharacterized protein n=1 Tax=Marinicella pacifica TaxID=1171543 RepID=A0A917CNZ1_9GAMM|nr:hypothetical protein [Marinicella pacifica]GGF92437.1 hypothetical protein GCM10011365_12050 [Marinicella pacifica]